MKQYSGAEAFIEVLNANGVANIFFNPGGEQAPIQAAVAESRVSGKCAPRLVLCLDESVAMTAAHGHYMVSGKPQVVMVHSELGTQQIGGALHNAQWGRIPVILWAGLSGAPQRVNWKKEAYDQGAMVRNCVKWDHELTVDENIYEVLGEAFRIAFSEPRGPVYLYYSRDLMNRKIDSEIVGPSAVSDLKPAASITNETLDKVAGMLIEAENPLIIAGYTGRYPESVSSLIELAETLGSPVLTSQVWMNFPTTHPLCAGIEQILGSRKGNPHITEADVLLVIDYDMPYAIAAGVPGKAARIIHIDVDPLTQGRPLWGRGADIFIQADSRQAIPAVTQAIRQKLTPGKRDKLNQRSERLGNAHINQRAAWRALAAGSAKIKPISPDWLCHCIAETIDNDTIVVNHNISLSASPTEQIDYTRPGTLLGCGAGSIQWALGAALGAKIAAPDRNVVSLMTDGGFIWGCPVAALWTARSYHAPFLSVIFDNQSYGFMRSLISRTAGEKEFTDAMAFEAGVDITPPPDYAGIAEACGAYGKMVDNPEDVLPVLKEAFRQIRAGRAAVVDVRLEKEHDWL